MTKRYRTIVADPPWMVHQPPKLGGSGFQKAGPNQRLPYDSMTVGAIERLPVADLAEDNAHLYLWTINRYVEASYAVVRAWGFKPSTLLTWCKPRMGQGPGGAYALTTEHVLFARRGAGAYVQRADSSWWLWPRGRHSAKPEAFLDLVESVSPGPYLEMFARRNRLGWDTWGDEALSHVEMAA